MMLPDSSLQNVSLLSHLSCHKCSRNCGRVPKETRPRGSLYPSDMVQLRCQEEDLKRLPQEVMREEKGGTGRWEIQGLGTG